MKIQVWEDSYNDDSVSTFGDSPNSWLIEYFEYFDKTWRLLDVGCGDGIDSLYLANNGFKNIDAFDISKNAINKMARLAKANNLQVNGWAQDINEYKFDRSYDFIMSFGTLHFLKKEARTKFLKKSKDNTSIGGINIIQILTDELPATPDIAPYAIGMAKDGELKELYNDWEIIKFISYITTHEHFGVPMHSHSCNKIFARRLI